jgi:ATP-dependent DNA ligase
MIECVSGNRLGRPNDSRSSRGWEAPTGDGWLRIKYDGYRIPCAHRRRQVKLLTRTGLDFHRRLKDLWIRYVINGV